MRGWPHLEKLELADPDYLSRDAIELLLGADAYARIALPGLRRRRPSEPIAQQTQLGWIILGAAGSIRAASTILSLHYALADDLPALIRCFWEQEEARASRCRSSRKSNSARITSSEFTRGQEAAAARCGYPSGGIRRISPPQAEVRVLSGMEHRFE